MLKKTPKIQPVPELKPTLRKHAKKATARGLRVNTVKTTDKVVATTTLVALSDTKPALDFIRTHLKSTLGFMPTRNQAAIFALHSYQTTGKLPVAHHKLRTIAADHVFTLTLPAKYHAKLLEAADKLSLYPAAALAVITTAVALKIHYHKNPEKRPPPPKKQPNQLLIPGTKWKSKKR